MTPRSQWTQEFYLEQKHFRAIMGLMIGAVSLDKRLAKDEKNHAIEPN